MKMNYTEFVNEIIERKEEFLPKELQNAELELRRNEKINGSYDALMIHVPELAVSAALNISGTYEHFGDRPMEEVLENLKSDVREIDFERVLKASNSGITGDYEDVKDKLYIRISNAEKNKDVLESCPNMKLGEVAMTVHVGLEWAEGDSPEYSTTVNNMILNNWGVTPGTLFSDAIANAEKRSPVKMRTLTEVMQEMLGDVDIPTPGTDLYVLTSKSPMYGAAVVCYPDTLAKAHEELGDFYMLPSSIHEWLLLPDGTGPDLEQLEDMVRGINKNEVRDEDFLSDEIYHYDGEKMELARDYEARMGLEHELEGVEAEPDYVPEEKGISM